MSLWPNTTLGKAWDSLMNKWTGKDLTGAQIAENEFNAQEAEKARVFNANEAEKARQWEEQMSNTAYQRQVADLQAAGLNPALGYSANGATTPSGEAATGPAATAGSNNNGMSLGEMLQGLSLPLSIMQQMADIDLTKAQEHKISGAEIPNIQASTDKLRADIENVNWDAKTKEKMYSWIDRLNEATIAVQESSVEEMNAHVRQFDKQIEKMDYEELSIMYNILETQEQINYLRKQESLTDEQMNKLRAEVTKLQKESRLIQLNIDNFDYITVLGSTSTTVGIGPFKGSGARPMTLEQYKNKVRSRMDDEAKEKSNDRKYHDAAGSYAR